MPVDEGRQLFAEPRIRLRSRRDPQYAGRRQRPAMPPLPGRNVGRQRSQELRPLPARLLPRPGAIRILQALPGRNFHPIGRIQNGRRVRSGLRIRNLFAHRIGPCALCPATSARRWSAKNDSAGGLCLSETHAAFCYCPAGFTGSFCEVNIDVWRLPLPVRPGLHEQKVPARRNLQRLAGEFPVPVPVRIYRRPLGEQNQRRRARLALP